MQTLSFESPKKPREPMSIQFTTMYDDNYMPKSVEHIALPQAENITDGIQQIEMEFSCINPTLIQAPTGFGKSYFVIHTLIPRIQKIGGTILFVSNRVAVSVQQKREVMELLDDPRSDLLTDKGIQVETNFGCVKIMTIQALSTFLAKKENQSYCDELTLLVVDEAHFFVADALFNGNCGYLLSQIPNRFRNSIRIYLTATPQDVLVPLANAEERAPLPLSLRLKRQGDSLAEPKMLRYLQMGATSYDRVHLRYFEKMETLVNQIQCSHDRWLIFVASKDDGWQLAQQLGDDAKFISAESKSTKEWESLLQTESLPSRILITTTVLDCGVNINDSSLRHVVVLLEDRVTLIQALGRKRLVPNETVTLYIKAPSLKYINGRLNELNKLEMTISAIENDHSYPKELKKLWYEPSLQSRLLLRPPFGSSLQLNEVAVHKVRRLEHLYQELKGQIESVGRAAFPQMVHRWLGHLDGYREENWLEYDRLPALQSDLNDLLSRYVDVPLSPTEQQEDFENNLVNLCKQIAGKETRQGRGKNASLGCQALNNCLKTLAAPYQMTKEDDFFVLRHLPNDANTPANVSDMNQIL